MVQQDATFKKVVTFKFRRETLRFRVSQDLFSSHQVDIGTQFLLRTVASSGTATFGHVLDLGCGYGPIGLTLKKVAGAGVLHMVDRDALALEYARQNAELNRLSGIEIYASLGYDDVAAKDFDLVLSNIPAKAGEPVITHFLRDAVHHLRPEGSVAVVVVASLAPGVAQILDSTPGCDLLLRKARPGHVVFHYRFAGAVEADGAKQNALERGAYHRNRVAHAFHHLTYQMQTAYGLPEFDSPGVAAGFLMEGMQRSQGRAVGRAVVFNVGQGHVPVALWKSVEPEQIALVDRDLLSLRYARENLCLNECPRERITLSHQVGVLSREGEQADLVVGVIREDEGSEAAALTIKHAAERLSPGGIALVSASSTAVTRLIGAVRSQGLLKIRERKRRRGISLLVMERI